MRKMLYKVTLLFVMMSFHTIWHDINGKTVFLQSNVHAETNYETENTSPDVPIIFWWTARLRPEVKTTEKLHCPNSLCLISTNRDYFEANDPRIRAFMFYGTDLDFADLPLPRRSFHEWALFHEESPMNNYVLTHSTFLNLINHTATFKRESHFPLTTQHIPSLNYLTERKPLSIELRNTYRKSNGFAPILFIQSHCDVASDRDRYVKELMNYINVDSYGKCVNNKNLPYDLQDPVESMHSEDFLKFISKYKFHLSFENAICEDYMTEKLFRALHVGSVPIYRGSTRAESFMPNNQSLILSDDFESPEALAKFISFLDGNDTEYNKYLIFKNVGITNEFLKSHINNRPWSTSGVVQSNSMFDFFEKPDMIAAFECYLCDELNFNINHKKKMLIDPNLAALKAKVADRSHMGCPQPYTSVGYPEDYPASDSWIHAGWIDDYWTCLDKALAVQSMIRENVSDSKKFYSYWEKSIVNNPRYKYRQ